MRGDWAGAAQAALWPVVALLVSAVACAVPTYGQDDEDFVGFGDRLRIAFAFVLQAVGGNPELTRSEDQGIDSASDSVVDGTFSVHLMPLTVTALFIGAVVIGARVLRNRLRQRGQSLPGATAGLEAAVRVAVLTALGVLVLALFGQPDVQDTEVSSGAFLATLGALALTLAVSAAVLQRDSSAAWLAARPGALAFSRALGTALRALVVVLILASVTGYISVTQIDAFNGSSDVSVSDVSDEEISPYFFLLLVLPNLGISALGLGWGAPLKSKAGGESRFGDDYERESFGLSKLEDVVNSGAVVGALALGLVCALVIGVLATRRCVRRGEQIMAAGICFALILLLAALGGLSVETTAKERGFGGDTATSTVEAGVSLPDLLLFGLLWVAGAVLVAVVFTARGTGVPPGPVPPVPPGAPGAPGTPGAPVAYAVPAPYAPTQGVLLPPAAPARQRGRVGVWAVTLAVALLAGGGVTAGVLVWQENQESSEGGSSASDGGGKHEGSAASRTDEPREDPPAATTEPTEPTGPADDEKSGATGGGEETVGDDAVPSGSERVRDPKGFSFAVPQGWSRKAGDNPTQSTYAAANGPENFLVGVIPNADYTSLGNLTNMEEHAEKDPDKSDYQRVRLEGNTFRGQSGAVWEYTYTDRADRTIHAINQSYIADDGTEYAIQLSWRESVWPAGHGARTHRTALNTWRVTE
ncbi:hypothetical protein RB200_31785 [Streptomyces sp. PmtG]